jgi:hypothetical protein
MMASISSVIHVVTDSCRIPGFLAIIYPKPSIDSVTRRKKCCHPARHRFYFQLYTDNTPLFSHIIINLAYIFLLCWPTHKSDKIWNSTALIEEKIDDLKNQ